MFIIITDIFNMHINVHHHKRMSLASNLHGREIKFVPNDYKPKFRIVKSQLETILQYFWMINLNDVYHTVLCYFLRVCYFCE